MKIFPFIELSTCLVVRFSERKSINGLDKRSVLILRLRTQKRGEEIKEKIKKLLNEGGLH
jgi:hypothetical protein